MYRGYLLCGDRPCPHRTSHHIAPFASANTVASALGITGRYDSRRHVAFSRFKGSVMKRRGFTLIELMVVMFIVVLMLGVCIPSVKAIMRGNSQAQAVNLIRANLATARSIAISQHRQAGVVFFEEMAANAPFANRGQTVVQLMIEAPDQTGAAAGFTVFNYYTKERQYLPPGIQVGTLNDVATKQILTGDNSGGASRVILFDANGQMILRNGIARPNNTGSADGGYPKAYVDWNITTKATAASYGVSSPGVIVFSMTDYKSAGMVAAADTAKASWVQQHSDVLIVNAYTGGVIR